MVSKKSFADGPLPMISISSSFLWGMPGVGRDLTTILPRESIVEIGMNVSVLGFQIYRLNNPKTCFIWPLRSKISSTNSLKAPSPPFFIVTTSQMALI